MIQLGYIAPLLVRRSLHRVVAWSGGNNDDNDVVNDGPTNGRENLLKGLLKIIEWNALWRSGRSNI